MKNNYKPNRDAALTSATKFELAIMNEAIEFSNQKEDDPILKIDTNKFYEHCNKKFFETIIDGNVKYLKLEKHFVTYALQMQFVCAMNNFALYDVEKIKLLELTEKFINDYKAYLNK